MKQTKTILFLSRLYHPYIGGVEKHVREISNELINKGYKIILVTESSNPALKKHEFIDGVEVFRIKVKSEGFGKKFLIWQWLIKNFRVIKKADIIHVHDVFYWILPFRFFIPFKKIFITFHGYEGYPIRWRWILQRKIAEKLCNGSICIGDFMKKWYKAKPTYVSYGGVRLKGKNIKPKPRTAVFFGRLHPQTGFLDYIKAYKIIKKKYPDFQLTVVGEGELGSKIPKGVKIVPFVKDVLPYIENNRFIFVSRYLSMLEALALKREVIAVYDNPVKKDYLKSSEFVDFVFIANNSKQIADYVRTKITKNYYFSKEVEKGYKWSKKQTWSEVSKIYLKLWN